MTLVLHETYGFGPTNFLKFWANRFLRLYPTYFIVITITALHIWLISPLTDIHSTLGLPQGIFGWLANLSMFGMAGPEISLRPVINFVPNAWSLSVELFCYLLLSVYFARTHRRAVALLVIGIAITGAQIIRVTVQAPPYYDVFNHYNVLQAGIIPFAVGSLAYFHRHAQMFRFSPARLAILLMLWAANCALAHVFDYHRFVSGLYLVIGINFILIAMMFRYDQAHHKTKLVRTLGAVSYPIFVSHILVGTLLVRYMGFAPSGSALLAATVAATIGFSLTLNFGVEQRIETLRSIIKRHRWALRFTSLRRDRIVGRLPAAE